jgi:prepilin-type N-terminal cleavage/methylation domain-containing protein
MKKINKAFTLIELLVVISIIGVLASIPIMNFATQLRKARDTQRKSDLKQYQYALTIYSIKNKGLYPSYVTNAVTLSSTVCPTSLHLSTCPDDPVKTTHYYYWSDGTDDTGGPSATKFVLWAKLESRTGPNIWWVNCSNGESGYYGPTAPDSSDCPTLTN